MNRKTNLPDGFGVFKTDYWVHCGKVRNEEFINGRMISVHAHEKVLKIVDIKFLVDGTVLDKVQRYSRYGVERSFRFPSGTFERLA